MSWVIARLIDSAEMGVPSSGIVEEDVDLARRDALRRRRRR